MSAKKNRSRLSSTIALLFAHQLALAATDMPAPLSSYWPDLGPNATFVSEIHDGASIALAGLITPGANASVQAILDKKKSIRALYIDSQGGDVAAAMALAEVVRQRKLRLVVAGRCLSACANYLFTAAVRKNVPPGSLVGIHGLSHHAILGDKMLTVDARDKDKLIAAARDPSLGAKIAVIERNERDFYARFGISTQ